MIGEEAVKSPDRGSYVALVNGLGGLGGFVGPYIITLFKPKESSLMWLGLVVMCSVVPSALVKKKKMGQI